MRSLILAGLVLAACDERENPGWSGVEVLNESRAGYPEGPYGWAEGEILPDWTFLDLDGRETSMQAIRAGTFASTLVLLPSAAWMESAPGMLRRASQLLTRDDVLILSAVFEDAGARAAEPADAVAWQTTYEVPWDVVAEPLGQFRLAWRNDMRAAVLIDLNTMKRLDPDLRPGIRDTLWP